MAVHEATKPTAGDGHGVSGTIPVKELGGDDHVILEKTIGTINRSWSKESAQRQEMATATALCAMGA